LEEFKGQIPKLLARGQTVSRGGRMCCGRFPWKTMPEAFGEGRQVENKLERVRFEIVGIVLKASPRRPGAPTPPPIPSRTPASAIYS
jgi:hypothetical protein